MPKPKPVTSKKAISKGKQRQVISSDDDVQESVADPIVPEDTQEEESESLPPLDPAPTVNPQPGEAHVPSTETEGPVNPPSAVAPAPQLPSSSATTDAVPEEDSTVAPPIQKKKVRRIFKKGSARGMCAL